MSTPKGDVFLVTDPSIKGEVIGRSKDKKNPRLYIWWGGTTYRWHDVKDVVLIKKEG